jgi:AcrR family transcriptional regulator
VTCRPKTGVTIPRVTAIVLTPLEPLKKGLEPSSPDQPQSLRERQKYRRKNRIYTVAIQLFKERGFDKTTATDVAKVAHVSRGTFFNYYPYKEAVLLDYGSQIIATLRERTNERRAQGHEAIDMLRALWKDLGDITSSERDLISPLAYELINPDPARSRTAYESLPLSKIIAGLLHDISGLRSDISLERIAGSLSDTYFMTALRWSTYRLERDIHDELNKALALTLEGAFKR